MSNIKKVFGTTEIARICYVTPATVGRWIEEGKLPYFSTGGGHRRVWGEDLLKFLKTHNMPVPAELENSGVCRVLIVDDAPQVRNIIARVVSKLTPDIEVHEAADGFEAGRKLAVLLPSLVVLDIMLPGIDGVKICRLIRNDPALKDISILAVSGHIKEGLKEECLRVGANDFLAKPFDVGELEKRLSRLLPVKVLEAKP